MTQLWGILMLLGRKDMNDPIKEFKMKQPSGQKENQEDECPGSHCLKCCLWVKEDED